MRVYIDTGIFIDYLISRGHSAHYLRANPRRGRAPQDLVQDAENCLDRIAKLHSGFTSALTFYEVEEALFAQLARLQASGVTHGRRFLIPAARAAMVQVQITVGLFNIQVLDLNHITIDQQIRNIDLQVRGIRAADSLHVTMAILNGADLILSTDSDVQDLDGVFQNGNGVPIRCMDSDVALTIR